MPPPTPTMVSVLRAREGEVLAKMDLAHSAELSMLSTASLRGECSCYTGSAPADARPLALTELSLASVMSALPDMCCTVTWSNGALRSLCWASSQRLPAPLQPTPCTLPRTIARHPGASRLSASPYSSQVRSRSIHGARPAPSSSLSLAAHSSASHAKMAKSRAHYCSR